MDRSRLPKWARQEMERLERDRDSWKEKALAAAGGGALRTPPSASIRSRTGGCLSAAP